jgi:hypothetical protein
MVASEQVFPAQAHFEECRPMDESGLSLLGIYYRVWHMMSPDT